MSVENDDYFSSIGDMYSGSYDPEEKNRALEREAEKKRREQEREQARILREQQAAQAELQKSLQPAPPSTPPVVIDNNQPASIPKLNPDDPLDGVPGEKRTDILLRKYDNRQPNDYMGQRLPPDRGKEFVQGWKK